ncbi:MAG: hypothetical protein HDR09_12540 [Lachnospiraceae bacterium]|nr:hypothetical protein [Lachnospiraceae bacterium]
MPFKAKTVEVKDYEVSHPNARNLAFDDDYTIIYKNNVKRGTATMTLAAASNI